MSNINNQQQKKGYANHSRAELYEFLSFPFEMVLDVGCNEGGFGAFIKQMKANITVWGVEPNPDAAHIAKEVLDQVIVGRFEENDEVLNSRAFDVVCFNDVLEHMYDPLKALNYAKKCLKRGGHILASIPNVLYYPVFFEEVIMQEDWRYVDYGTLDRTHLRFFTKKSITRLFLEAGFTIKQIQGINPTITPEYEILNKILSNRIEEWKYLQFVVVAQI